MNEAKRNLEIKPLELNFMALDSYRSMNQLKAETLDPTLLSWLKKDFKTSFKEEK